MSIQKNEKYFFIKYQQLKAIITLIVAMTSALTPTITTMLMQQLYDHNLENYTCGNNVLWLSRHHLTTINVLLANMHICWDMDAISLNPSIKMKDVAEYSELKWNWNYLTHNPNFTMEFYNLFPDKPWDYQRVAMMKNVSVLNIFNNEQCREFAHIETPEDLNYENMDQSTMFGF